MSKNNVKTFTENELHFTEDNQLREKYINRTEVLNKIKELFLIPHMELMTMRQVAECIMKLMLRRLRNSTKETTMNLNLMERRNIQSVM